MSTITSCERSMTPTITPQLVSKHPAMGTTIFSVMSALATESGAVNLGQGFPDFECDPQLIADVSSAMHQGLNQYPPMPGVAPLRQAVSEKIEKLYGHHYDPNTEITVTAGATQAILTIMLAVVHPGDEVIVLEPCYDSYVPNIDMAGGVVVRVPLTPGTFRPDFDKIQAAISARTRAILINSPHNPSGMVWRHEDMLKLQEILAPTSIVLIARAFVVSSFGKTYHVTGWKVGTVAAPAALTAEFRKVHQFNVFTVNTPVQHGLANYMKDPGPYLDLPDFYQRKRDLFRAGLAQTKFKMLPGEGTYFQCVDISELSVPEKSLGESEFCKWLTRDVCVAAIPMSAFYGNGFDQNVIRFCFAKKDETLNTALARLARL